VKNQREIKGFMPLFSLLVYHHRISLAGIARSLQVSSTWLQGFVNHFLAQVPCYFKDLGASGAGIILECDELWSFVGNKENQAWCWIALDRQTRRIVGLYIGDRSRESAQKLWDSLPKSYQSCQFCYTDFWEAYVQVIPDDVHQPSSKKSHIERLNNTLRQRCSRLVRKTLSFSKDWLNHENAIWYFAHHYNSVLGFS
jgi:insertion element IS1 protein InsB